VEPVELTVTRREHMREKLNELEKHSMNKII
jgi:hypothetical protein